MSTSPTCALRAGAMIDVAVADVGHQRVQQGRVGLAVLPGDHFSIPAGQGAVPLVALLGASKAPVEDDLGDQIGQRPILWRQSADTVYSGVI